MLYSRTSALLTVVLAATSALASAPGICAREPWNPRILSPDHNTLLVTGTVAMVTWNTTNAPKEISGGSQLCLAKGGSILPRGPGSLGKNLFWVALENETECIFVTYHVTERPIIKDFDLRKGSINFLVPVELAPGNDYQIVLFGSSDNRSEKFEIKN